MSEGCSCERAGVSWRRLFPVKICRSSPLFFQRPSVRRVGATKKITRKGARMVGSTPPSLEWIGAAGRKCVPPGHKKVWPAIYRESLASSSNHQSITGNLKFSSFPQKETSQPWLTSSVDHAIFVHRKFPFKKLANQKTAGKIRTNAEIDYNDAE